MTTARSDFLASSATVAALLEIERGYQDPPPQSDQAAVEGLRGGAVVIVVAALESYLKESIAEVLDRINNANPPCDFAKLPIDIQTRAVYTGLYAAMKPKPWDPIQDHQLRLPGVLLAVQRINKREIMSSEIADTAGNPNSAQVKSIFKIVGLPAVFSNVKPGFDAMWGTPTATTFIQNMLDTVVRMRHTVAHTASIRSISRTDIANWHRFLNTFVTVIDAALERHIARIISRAQ